MRALIIISASLATVIEPSSTCATNSFTRFLPRSLADGSGAMRPSSTIVSSKLRSVTCSAACAAACCFESAIGASLRGSAAHLTLQFLELFRAAHRIQQRLFQLVVALQAAAQIREPGAQIEQLAERLHLPRHVLRLEIVHALELQIDFQIWRVWIFAQLVLDIEAQMRLHAFEHRIEIIRGDFHELAIFQLRQRLFRLPSEVAQYSHDER